MRYCLTCIPVRFIPEKTHGTREFDAPNDETAIRHSEHPVYPLKIIDPVAGDAVATVPRELIELTEPPRVVKRWDTPPQEPQRKPLSFQQRALPLSSLDDVYND